MAKGNSGRIVIDIDPALKRRLYSALAMENSTLKDWFIEIAERFLTNPRSASEPSKRRPRK
jgi:hypothetical protein